MQWEARLIEHTGQRASDASQRRIQNAAHLFAQGGAVFRVFLSAPVELRVVEDEPVTETV